MTRPVWYPCPMAARPDIDLELIQRTAKLEIRVTPDAKNRAKVAAALDGGKNLSEFVRAALRERTRRLLKEHGLD